ncbi:hypothetical protein [Uliginosibacterium sediminicola]|uniref:Tetratricopeptide repeat protein n=1 Tax=Uliginosibacterium sediminicola TaxID=2024550 RepID=A0ABU9YZK1_9RHOO
MPEISVHTKQDAIPPFWLKLPFFLLFPFRLGPLVFMVCIIAGSALAGLAFGSLGLILKGSLAYLGLRYAFNVLDLFSQGRFESESVDNNLWGPEKRPAKFGLVIALFLLAGATLGNKLLDSRIKNDASAQTLILERYKAEQSKAMEDAARQREAFNQRIGLDSAKPASAPAPAATERNASGEDDEDAADRALSSSELSATMPSALPGGSDTAANTDGARHRAEILEMYRPQLGDALWFKLQPTWFWLIMAALSLMLPASAIVIALEDRFFKALNPGNILLLGNAMGKAYFALWALFLLIVGSRQLAMSAGQHWPIYIRFPLEMGIANYLGLVLFAMMGYALYQYHQELGLDVSVDFDSHQRAGGVSGIAKAGSAHAALRKNEATDPLERKIQAALEAGDVDEAIAELKDAMRYDRFDPVQNTRMHELYVIKGDLKLTLSHGQQWLSALTRAQRGVEGLGALQKLRELDPSFAITDSNIIFPLAQAAYQKRDYKCAIELIRGFEKRFPKHKDTAAVFLLGAKISSEFLRKDEQAIKMLRAVITHFPDDANIAEAKVYLSVLEKIMSSATPARSAG